MHPPCGKGRNDMTSSQDVSRVKESKCICMASHGWEVNTIQFPSFPTGRDTLFNIVPSNPQKLQPPWAVVWVFFTKVDDICMEDTKDTCVAKWVRAWIICKCGVECHDVTLRRPWVYHVFSAPNVIGCIVDTHDVMSVESIMFKHNCLPISLRRGTHSIHVPPVYLGKMCPNPGKKMLL